MSHAYKALFRIPTARPYNSEALGVACGFFTMHVNFTCTCIDRRDVNETNTKAAVGTLLQKTVCGMVTSLELQ